MADVRKQTTCRMCGSERLQPFFDLGDQPLANSLLHDLSQKDEPRYPLGLLFCNNCTLVQLSHVVRPELMFAHDYVYFSSGIPHRPHFIQYADEVKTRFLNKRDNFVVEIGSNDGHFLQLIQQYGVRVLGEDPAKNAVALARERGVPTRCEFFGESAAKKILSESGKANVIIGNNVVAHIDDHDDLMSGVNILLAPRGVFIFEAPYLGDMFDNLAFDSIYHEHMSYLALRPLTKFLEKFGLEIFDVKPFPVQGNSLRYYAAHKGDWHVEPSVFRYLKIEEERGFGTFETYEGLVKKIDLLRSAVRGTLLKLKREGKTISAYGASARGNTLLNYFGIDRSVLSFATEELSSKIGKFTPGAHIPIVDIAWARAHAPDYFLLLAWPYKNVILEKEKEFIVGGGKFILPVGGGEIIP